MEIQFHSSLIASTCHFVVFFAKLFNGPDKKVRKKPICLLRHSLGKPSWLLERPLSATKRGETRHTVTLSSQISVLLGLTVIFRKFLPWFHIAKKVPDQFWNHSAHHRTSSACSWDKYVMEVQSIKMFELSGRELPISRHPLALGLPSKCLHLRTLWFTKDRTNLGTNDSPMRAAMERCSFI